MAEICKSKFKKTKKCAVIYGGGKDAHLTLMSALKQGFKIACLVVFDAGKTHHYFFSDLRKIEIVKEHAKLLKTKLLIFKISSSLQKAPLKTLFLKVVQKILKEYKVDAIFAGNTEDKEEAKIWKEVGKIMNVRVKLPLENKNIFDIINFCTKNGVFPLIVAIEKNVDKFWLGKIMDKKLINYIKRERENGNYLDGNDFQSLVIKSPILKKRMKIIKIEFFKYDTTTYLKIKDFKFV